MFWTAPNIGRSGPGPATDCDRQQLRQALQEHVEGHHKHEKLL
jgi:hypothetical protein